MNRSVLLNYADIKIQIAKLEAEAEMMKPLVLEEIKAIQGDTQDPVQLQDLPGYQFSVNKGRKKWTYSPLAVNLEKELKEIQKQEQADGTATFEESEPVLVFKQIKE